MALTVSFGNGGNAAASTLVDAEALTGGRAIDETKTASTTDSSSGETIAPGSTSVGAIAVPGEGGGSGTGGSVGYEYDPTDGSFNFDVAGKWNSVKNASATLVGDTHGEDVTFSDFVHVDVDFSSATSGSSVTIENVKRTNVTTGAYDDTVNITLSSNTSDWQNLANVKTGAGVDNIKIGAGSVVDGAKFTDGRFTTVTVDAGAGNDTIDLSGLSLKSSTITGGTGNDTMTGNLNSDFYVYGKGNLGNDTITNFEISGANRDHLSFTDGNTIKGILDSGVDDDGHSYTIASLKNGGTITFLGIEASKADLLG
ncbi:MAG: rhizobiocin [Methylobacterium mesophilicum]|nr:rhizobiocin [Methylobacterium mesophilicum]